MADANYQAEFTAHQQQISLYRGQVEMHGQVHVGNGSKKPQIPQLPHAGDRHMRISKNEQRPLH